MLHKLKRIFLWILLVEAVVWVGGQVISRKMTKGDEASDDFQVVAIGGGKKFHSYAGCLKSATAIASMGGIDLDLRDAILDPSGAELELKATMGGVQVFVPEGWAIDVEEETFAGGFISKVAPPEELPEDAPKLHIHAVTRLGGGLVTSKVG